MNLCPALGKIVSFETPKLELKPNSNNRTEFKDMLKNKSLEENANGDELERGIKKTKESSKNKMYKTGENSFAKDEESLNKDSLFINEIFQDTEGDFFNLGCFLNLQKEDVLQTPDDLSESISKSTRTVGNIDITSGLGKELLQCGLKKDLGAFEESSGYAKDLENKELELNNLKGALSESYTDTKRGDSVSSFGYELGISKKISKTSEDTENYKSSLFENENDDTEALSFLNLEQREGVLNIKVAEPYDSASFKYAAEEIAKAVTQGFKENKMEKLKIIMNPKELGEIRLEISVEKDKISLSFICDNENTKSLLSENMGALSRIVKENLSQETVINIYNEKNGGKENNGENFEGRGGNSHYKDDSRQEKDKKEPEQDFLQKLRIGIVGREEI